jgi:putative SOS response-associated peptidase YedK
MCYYNGQKVTRVEYIRLKQLGKMYREAALKMRCLVLSSGFFEWRHVFPANKRTGLPVKTTIKYPYHISIPGRPYFYMAGIWQPWKVKIPANMLKRLPL